MVPVRRVLLALLGAVLVAGLFNLFGQRPHTSTASASAASLKVYAPAHVRPGLIYAARYSVTGIVLAAGTIGLLATVTAFITYRSNRIRSAVEGEPVILVQDGQPIERNMKNERLTLEEVMEQARLQEGIESLDEVKWAVLETNGSISVIEKK